jgi:hypothetical protein
MYLYEIKAAIFSHQLNELASADIDRDLDKAAGEISAATGPGQDAGGQDAEAGAEAGFGGYFNNHSSRATAATRLYKKSSSKQICAVVKASLCSHKK